MRINQVYSGFGWLHMQELFKKYNLHPARDHNQPCLFFGVYGVQIWRAIEWSDNQPIKIWWSGSDILYHKKNKEVMDILKKRTDIHHIATVNFKEKDLVEMGLPYKKVPLFTRISENFHPEPLGDAIYVYHPGSPIYCPRVLYQKIRDKFPSVEFIEVHNHHAYNNEQLIDVYKRSFLALRFTKSDGLSHTACEMGLMGREILWQGDTPNAINYTDDNDILLKIEEAIDLKNSDRNRAFEIAQNTYQYLDVGDDWLSV